MDGVAVCAHRDDDMERLLGGSVTGPGWRVRLGKGKGDRIIIEVRAAAAVNQSNGAWPRGRGN